MTQNSTFRLYRVRSFGDKIDETFGFIRQNLRPLIKYVTYLLLPVCLVQGFTMNSYMSSTLYGQNVSSEFEPMGLAMSFGGLLATSVVGGLLLISVVYALMHLCQTSPDQMHALTGQELKPRLVFNLKRLAGLLLFGVVVTAVGTLLIAALAAVSGWLAALAVIGLMVVGVPLALLAPIYLFEDITLIDAVRKTFHLGFPTWGGTLGLTIVLILLISVVQGLFSMPYYIVFGVKAYFALEGDGGSFADGVGYSFLLYLVSVFQSYITYLSNGVLLIAWALQYGHAAEKIDHVSMEQTIAHFEQL